MIGLLTLLAALAFDLPIPEAARPAPVIATFYYTWYATDAHDGHWDHWDEYGRQPPADIASDFYPALGPYSSHDPAVLDQHMRWMRAAGIDLAIITWKGRDHRTDDVAPGVLDAAATHDIRVAIHVETYPGRSPQSLPADIAYLESTFGDHPAYFRSTQGSPHSADGPARGVYFLWDPDFEHTDGPANDGSYWRPALDAIHAAGDGAIVLASVIDPDFVARGHFDGSYAYFHRGTEERRLREQVFFWVQEMPRDAWTVPSVTPGYSCRRVAYHHTANMSRRQGRTFDEQWRQVVDTGVLPRMITITSFNEWHEGTMIEPAVCWQDDGLEHEYDCYAMGPEQYLVATATWAEHFARTADPATWPSVAVELGAPNANRGLYQHERPDGITEVLRDGHRHGRRAVRNEHHDVRYMYFWVSDDFHRGTATDMALRVEYRDDGPGFIAVEYDATEAAPGRDPAYRRGPVIAMEGTGEWRSALVRLPGAVFDNRQHSGGDLRLSAPLDYVVGRVTLMRAREADHR